MYQSLTDALKRGIQKIRDNPQLVFTLSLALVIFLSYLFMTQRFVSIAQDAQDRLINVRIGSMQDAFVELIKDDLEDPIALNEGIQAIAGHNQTIHEFKIVDITNAERQVVASLIPEEIGEPEAQNNSQLYQLAQADPGNSYTIAIVQGGTRYFRTARAITDNDGKPVAIVVTTESLSKADQAINNSIRSSIVIFAIVIALVMVLFFRHSRIIDYTTLYKRLKEVDQLKDDFIAMASHELRTPLTIIRGYAEFILGSNELTDKTKEYAVHIDNASKQLNFLISDMLDVSRIEQGRMTFENKVQDAHPLVESTVETFKVQANDKKLALSYTGVSGIISVDTQRFNQVLINLIGNAIKYTKEGSVTVKSYIEDEKYMIRISDTGIGLSSEEQKHMFEKFYRVKSEETKEITGTGLGLWITSQMVKKMDGTISIESIKGKGTDFILAFPIQQQKA
jgi:signal transduction histidine kinase